MRRVGIVTDSTACIPAELAAEHRIEVVPVHLAFGDRLFREGLDMTARDFYDTLRTAREPPTTAAPPPGLYADAILRAGEQAGAILCITVSRQFSAMYDAAVQGAAIARERSPGTKILVLDSEAAAMAQGFLALEAARASAEGTPLHVAVDRARALMPRVQLLVLLDTLTYLARSGRVPRLLIWAASPLRVKPLVQYQGGKYRPIGVVRSVERGMERLIEALRRRAGDGALHVCVHHTYAPERADLLAARVLDVLAPQELFTAEFTQVMGVHTGPGLLGFAFYTEP